MRKPVFGISDKVRLKPACSATETSKSFEIYDLANNKGAEQTVHFVVRIWLKQVFS